MVSCQHVLRTRSVGAAGNAAFIPIDEHDIVMDSVLVNVALRHKEIRHIFINAADLGEIFPHDAVVGAAEVEAGTPVRSSVGVSGVSFRSVATASAKLFPRNGYSGFGSYRLHTC